MPELDWCSGAPSNVVVLNSKVCLLFLLLLMLLPSHLMQFSCFTLVDHHHYHQNFWNVPFFLCLLISVYTKLLPIATLFDTLFSWLHLDSIFLNFTTFVATFFCFFSYQFIFLFFFSAWLFHDNYGHYSTHTLTNNPTVHKSSGQSPQSPISALATYHYISKLD